MSIFRGLIDDPVKTVRESLSFFYGPTDDQAACNKGCDDLIAQVEAALAEMEALFISPLEQIDLEAGTEWQLRNKGLMIDIQPQRIAKYKTAAQFNLLEQKQREMDFMAKTLLPRIRKHNSNVAKLMKGASDNAYAIAEAQIVCPICGGQMVMRTGPRGKYLGCSNFAANGCRYARPLTKSLASEEPVENAEITELPQ